MKSPTAMECGLAPTVKLVAVEKLPSIAFNTVNIPFFLATGDLNGDGKLDLVSADGFDQRVTLLLGKGDGSFHKPVHVPIAGIAQCLVVGDFNKDGALDVATGVDWLIDSGVTVLLNTE